MKSIFKALLLSGVFCAAMAQDSDAPQDSAAAVAAIQNVESIQTDSAVVSVKQNPYGLPDELMPLWDSLSLKQKAAQMVMVYMTPADFMIEHEFGGFLVMKNHLKTMEKFKDQLGKVNATMRIPPLVATDQEGGLVNRAAVISPRWEKTYSAKSMRQLPTDTVESIGREIGKDLHDVGINLNLAPVLDPARDSRGKESFMEVSGRSWGDDTVNAYKVRAFVSGMRQSGIACVSKHFPGYDSWTNSDHQIAISATPKARIAKNIEFFKALAPDIPVTMMSSVRFVRISNKPAVLEPKIVQMARDMDPETVVLTDDMWGVSLRAWISGTERVKGKNYPAKDFKKLVQTALVAGNDMFMITFPRKAIDMVNYLTAMANQNKKYRLRIEESAARILKMKYKAGILKAN